VGRGRDKNGEEMEKGNSKKDYIQREENMEV
jgi:hypothetical protein